MYSASSWQFATKSASASTIWVWGVIGYAETTCGRQRRTASATACDPSVISIIYFSSCFMVIASLGHSAAQIPQPLQYVKSGSKNPSASSWMHPSGQSVLHIPHFEHFSWSKTGLKTRHDPVLLSRDLPG